MARERREPSALRTLVVEDDGVVREAFVTWLSSQLGLRIVAAVGSGEDALDVLDEVRPDLGLLDIGLPGIDGFATCERLLERAPGLRVVMVTVFAAPEHEHRALDAGAHGLVAKSSDPGVLEWAITEVTGGGTYVDAAILGSRPLSSRECQVLTALAHGMNAVEVARALNLSYNTVRDHVESAKEKLGVETRNEAIAEVARRGLA